MKMDCYITHGCGSEAALRENVNKAVSFEDAAVEVQFHHVSDEEAVALGLRGSPSVHINGRDIELTGGAGGPGVPGSS